MIDIKKEDVLSNKEEGIFEINEPHEFYNANRDFTTLDAWIKCRDVKLFFFNKVIIRLPAEEKYNLEIQIRKASVSATANIAEGYGRYHYQEEIQFYRISRGSLFELKDHLISCFDFGFINAELKDEGEKLIESAKVILTVTSILLEIKSTRPKGNEMTFILYTFIPYTLYLTRRLKC